MKYTYLIDSAKRNKSSYPNASSFVIPISTRTNIRHVKLLRAGIFNSSYMINSSNDSFFISLSGNTVNPQFDTITIPHGDYTPTSLGNEISQLVTNRFPNYDLSVTPNSSTNKFTFDSSTATGLRLNFQQNQLNPINPVWVRCFNLLGLETTPGYGLGIDVSLPHTATNVYQVRKTRYYQIEIEEIRTAGGDESFFITNDETSNGLLSFDTSPIVTMNTDISAISRFTVKLKDEEGNLVDLNGTDWHLYLELDDE